MLAAEVGPRADQLSATLCGAGHRVTVVGDGFELLNAWTFAWLTTGHPPFDLVVTEGTLPLLSGQEAIRELRQFSGCWAPSVVAVRGPDWDADDVASPVRDALGPGTAGPPRSAGARVRVSTGTSSDALCLQRWEDDGGAGSRREASQDPNHVRRGARVGGGRLGVGGLLVLTGYAGERLGHLAALLSEALPGALWAPPPERHDGEREVMLARSHLLAGTTVVLVAETSRLGLFMDLAERTGARFLHVLSPPPSMPGDPSEPPLEPDTTQPATPQRVVVQANAPLTTQLAVVMAAWAQPRETPRGA